MTKSFLTLAATVGALNFGYAAVQSFPFEDHFSYSAGNLYTVAAGVWDAGGSAGTELTVGSSAALTAPPGFADASGGGLKWIPSGTARR